jgi:hypothetical protein
MIGSRACRSLFAPNRVDLFPACLAAYLPCVRLPSKPVLVTAAASMIAIVGGVVAFLIWTSGNADPDTDPPIPDTVVVRTTAYPGEQANLAAVTEVVRLLPEQFAKGDAGSLTEEARSRWGDVRTALPPGSTLTVQPESWRRTGLVASVQVVMHSPGRADMQFMVVFAKDQGTWKVSSTYQVSA